MNSKDLKKLREESGLTQSQLATRIGAHARTVARWESGVTAITQEIEDRIKVAVNAKRIPIDLTRATSTELALELLNRAQHWDRLEAAEKAKEFREESEHP